MPRKNDFQCLVGTLLYVAVNTRPDIAISASILGRKVSNPSQADWTEAKRNLRYLMSTADLKLEFGGPGQLQAYVDAGCRRPSRLLIKLGLCFPSGRTDF